MTIEEIEGLLRLAETKLKNNNIKEVEVLTRRVIDNLSSEKLIDNSTHLYTKTSWYFIAQSSQLLCESLWRQGQINEALQYGNQAILHAKEINNLEIQAAALNDLGCIYSKKSDYFTSIKYFKDAIEYYEKVGNIETVNVVSLNIGSAYMLLSDYTLALAHYMKALTYFENSNTRQLAGLLGNIGVLFMYLLDYSSALEYYNKSLYLTRKLELKELEASMLGNIAAIYTHTLDYQIALEYFKEATIIFESVGNTFNIANSHASLGAIYYFLLDFQNSLTFNFRALAQFRELGMKSHISNALTYIGRIYGNKGYSNYNPMRAELYFKNAISIIEHSGAMVELGHVYQHISTLYEQENDHVKALEYYKKFHELTITVQNEEVKKQADKFVWEQKLADMEKEREIELLKTDAEKALLNETILHQKKRLETQAFEVENSIQELVKKNGLLQQIQSDIKKIAPHTKREGIDAIEHLLDRVSATSHLSIRSKN
ncbi:MAG: tetratricopeptide repeat protein [Ignavibacteria bacterium]|nr:tetratricopeptide repeat protein [Ignavibacteria bacterium]